MTGEESSAVQPGVVVVLGVVAIVLGSGFGPGASARGGPWEPVDPRAVRATIPPGYDVVRVTGLSPANVAVIGAGGFEAFGEPPVRLYTADAAPDDPTYPPVKVRLEAAHDAILIRPAYPLLPGHPYRVLLGPARPSDPPPTELLVRAPAADPGPAPRVRAIYPSSDRLPANQLKLYVEFSRPMRRWNPYAFVRLVDEATGGTIDNAFHSMRDGLWDPAGTRVTLVLDPGRIKRGLANHEHLGEPLQEGRRYRLVIDSAWTDVGGRTLSSPIEKAFEVTAADRTSPDPSEWVVEAPDPETRSPVRVRFAEPLDRAVALASLSVAGASGRLVEGRSATGPGERSWSFTPLRPWPPGEYELRVDSRLEDLAGNSVIRLFDVDLADAGAEPGDAPDASAPILRIPFSVVPKGAPPIAP